VWVTDLGEVFSSTTLFVAAGIHLLLAVFLRNKTRWLVCDLFVAALFLSAAAYVQGGIGSVYATWAIVAVSALALVVLNKFVGRGDSI
jgi:hypothetical protein